MNSIDFIEAALGIASGSIILGLFVWIGVCLQLAYTRMDEMLELLKNCPAIMTHTPLMQGGPLADYC
ncbi:hypothetical protein PBOI14_30140 [Pseudomonas sp. Boi14]|nr:hypothetical protein PBOI14_30140 [Pseudomonas sp. Boi14]